jgi:hypothetical protein
MIIRSFLILLISMTYPCFAFKTLLVEKGYVYEMYDPHDEIPLDVLNEGVAMYFEAYLNPKLHNGISLKTLQVDEAKFASYDEFISDMFQRDFISYQFPDTTPRLYLQARLAQDGRIVGVCAILEQTPGTYYMDHMGVDKDFRRQKIATICGRVWWFSDTWSIYCPKCGSIGN